MLLPFTALVIFDGHGHIFLHHNQCLRNLYWKRSRQVFEFKKIRPYMEVAANDA